MPKASKANITSHINYHS